MEEDTIPTYEEGMDGQNRGSGTDTIAGFIDDSAMSLALSGYGNIPKLELKPNSAGQEPSTDKDLKRWDCGSES